MCGEVVVTIHLLNGRELELRVKGLELLVGGRFLVLAIALGGVENDFTLEVHGGCVQEQLLCLMRSGYCITCHVARHVRDGDFVLFTHGEDDRVRAVVAAHYPHL